MYKKIVQYFEKMCYSIFRIERMKVIRVNGRYSALDIATWFIYKTNSEVKEHSNDDDIYEGITHLKLQKLLYYAQGISLALLGVALFREKILTWPHGPVVNEVYDVYKTYGKKDIPSKSTSAKNEIISRIENDQEVSHILNIVYDNFAIYTAWQLREMTHEEGSPWDVTVRSRGMNKEIKCDLIRDYFTRVVIES